jgi:hypothetical protein
MLCCTFILCYQGVRSVFPSPLVAVYLELLPLGEGGILYYVAHFLCYQGVRSVFPSPLVAVYLGLLPLGEDGILYYIAHIHSIEL